MVFHAFTGFAAQAKPARFESAEASTCHTPPFRFKSGNATGTQGIGICSALCAYYIAICWAIFLVGAQSTAKS